ncbi:uncharacterized protein DS421_13g402660 [Arachis hypogaea]|nr:uncharacterized protein DS421_13g402660 [Arachis hypogaea]
MGLPLQGPPLTIYKGKIGSSPEVAPPLSYTKYSGPRASLAGSPRPDEPLPSPRILTRTDRYPTYRTVTVCASFRILWLRKIDAIETWLINRGLPALHSSRYKIHQQSHSISEFGHSMRDNIGECEGGTGGTGGVVDM